MKIWTGTSGFGYKEWLGTFYPEDLKADAMLEYYAKKLGAVEINNTFYRFPKKAVIEAWAEQVPADFKFVIKAPMRITHRMRLKEAEKEVHDLCDVTSVLEKKLGAILFQLPPNLRRDDERLQNFLRWLPQENAAAFEFRHDSWMCEDIYKLLRERNCALCLSDTDEAPDPELVSTADFGYVRLRREQYNADDLTRWKKQLAQMPWKNVFVFFKHEDGAVGPQMAADFAKAR